MLIEENFHESRNGNENISDNLCGLDFLLRLKIKLKLVSLKALGDEFTASALNSL